MNIRVIKFGGTSVRNNEMRDKAANKVIQAIQQGYAPVVVVSAIGRAGEPYATDTLIKYLREIDHTNEPNARELDLMMACGEIISTVVFAHTLKIKGFNAVALTGGQAGIVTDSAFGTARILEIHPDPIMNYINKGYIPVVCGFQGVAKAGPGGEHGAITTLGRGGSDTTASALGAALHAAAVDIFTDVDGVKTADPSAVENAPTLRKITYAEVAEIAHQGAKVLHPRAAEIANRYNIPLWVKNTLSDDIGTEVVNEKVIRGRPITGVTHTGKLKYLTFEMPSDSHRRLIELEIYKVVEKTETNLMIIAVNPGFLGFAFPTNKFKAISDCLDGLVIPFNDSAGHHCYVLQIGDKPSSMVEVQIKLLQKAGVLGEIIPIIARVADNCALVSVIGQVSGDQPGIFYNVLEALSNADIPVLQTADSDYSLSCLVPENDAYRAVKILHERFELDKAE